MGGERHFLFEPHERSQHRGEKDGVRAVTLWKAAKMGVFPPPNKKHSGMGAKDQEKDCSEAIL